MVEYSQQLHRAECLLTQTRVLHHTICFLKPTGKVLLLTHSYPGLNNLTYHKIIYIEALPSYNNSGREVCLCKAMVGSICPEKKKQQKQTKENIQVQSSVSLYQYLSHKVS